MLINKENLRNHRERGNALFLILIAVALFAALSYAITQSGRGGGSVSQQTALITAGQMTEEPADIRSAVTRMVLTGVTGTNITFTGAATANDVFDSANGGGGATNVPPPAAACNTTADCSAWVYIPAYVATGTHGYFITGVGSAGVNGSDALAVLQGPNTANNGITSQVCTAIQKGLGFATSTPPTLAATVDLTTATGAATAASTTAGYAAAGNAATISDGASPTLSNQDFACVKNNNAYAYYGSLLDQ